MAVYSTPTPMTFPGQITMAPPSTTPYEPYYSTEMMGVANPTQAQYMQQKNAAYAALPQPKYTYGYQDPLASEIWDKYFPTQTGGDWTAFTSDYMKELQPEEHNTSYQYPLDPSEWGTSRQGGVYDVMAEEYAKAGGTMLHPSVAEDYKDVWGTSVGQGLTPATPEEAALASGGSSHSLAPEVMGRLWQPEGAAYSPELMEGMWAPEEEEEEELPEERRKNLTEEQRNNLIV
jgi:hypothetical protein